MKLNTLLPLAAGAALCLGTLGLSACKKADDQPKAAAGGDLLPRSVGDDMLPYDTVQSQASLSAPDAPLDPATRRAAAPDTTASAVPADEAVLVPATPPEAEPATP